jgi:hypothetical protein
MEVGLEINVERTKYMLLSRHQNAGQNLDIEIGNRSFENVSQFQYFWEWQQQIKISRSKLRGDWILVTLATIRSRTFCLLVCYQKNIKIKLYKTDFTCGSVWLWNLVSNNKGGT